MAAQHVYREGNQWGMTVAELLEAAVAEGRPLALDWDQDGKTWHWPGNRFHTIVMPEITDDTEPIAAATKHGKENQP